MTLNNSNLFLFRLMRPFDLFGPGVFITTKKASAFALAFLTAYSSICGGCTRLVGESGCAWALISQSKRVILPGDLSVLGDKS